MVFTSCGWFGGLVSVIFGGFGLVWVGAICGIRVGCGLLVWLRVNCLCLFVGLVVLRHLVVVIVLLFGGYC